MGLFTIQTIKKFNFKNPRRRVAFWKKLDRHISSTVRQILMKFGMLMQNRYSNLIGGYNIQNFTYKRWWTSATVTQIA